ncbi:MAG TPA: DUF4837 family protein, partial [Anaerolineales bacterium]
MNDRKAIALLTLFLALLLAAACKRQPAGFGEGTELFVVADSSTWQACETVLRDAFEKAINTPMPEPLFQVVWVAPEQFSKVANRKNLALVGTLDSEGEISQKIAGMLAGDVRAKVEEGSAFVFPKENPWASGQLLLVLASNNTEELKTRIGESKDYLYGLLYDHLLQDTKA